MLDILSFERRNGRKARKLLSLAQFLGWHVRPKTSFTVGKQMVLSAQSPLLIWQMLAANGHSLVTAVIPYIL